MRRDSLAESLTKRELEILTLLAASHTNNEIASKLSVSLNTVKWYTGQIFGKLGVVNRRQAVEKAGELGLLVSPTTESAEKNGPRLPTGTITFLFTDIEGSTTLWEKMPEAMAVSVAQHHKILRLAIEDREGTIYQIVGDSFQAAFRLAIQGLNAAIAAQRALQAAQWGATGPIKVRMGLHTGQAELDLSANAPYAVSHTLNRAARVMSAGYGGQILLSQEAKDLVERDLPPAVDLTDLGEQRLKGMARLERLYQVVAPDLPSGFPPLATAIHHPNNLPMRLTSFIGREDQMAAVRNLLRNHRMVTLTGSGGTGKTRLALRMAEWLLEDYQDGVWLVELAPLVDPTLIPQTMADAVGAREIPGKTMLKVLMEHLRSRQLLLILDNCEHLIEACAALASDLLETCPNLTILATSREILGTEGEFPYRVPSLSVPDARQVVSFEQVASYEAVRLFMERAIQVSPGFALTPENAHGIVRICGRLDGIPLAIELAAARVRMLSVDQIAARLDEFFRLLTGGSRTVLARHQNLQALIDWSYNLLSPEERLVLASLSIFAGGWTLEAAEVVCGEGPGEVFPILAQLVDRSLVMVIAEDDGSNRYRLLETIRQYTNEKLLAFYDTEERKRLRDLHLDYYLKLVGAAEPHLRAAKQVTWLNQLERELDNLRLALEWSLFDRQQEGLRLATALLWFWHIHGHGSEGVDWLERLLDSESQAQRNLQETRDQPLNRAKALFAVGFLTRMDNQIAKPTAYLTESLEICRGLGAAGKLALAGCLQNLASLAADKNTAEKMLQESLSISRELGDKFYIAESLQDLGGRMLNQGRFDEALVAIEEDLTLRRELGDNDGIGSTLSLLGNLVLMKGDPDRALLYYEESLVCYQVVNNLGYVSRTIFNIVSAAWVSGNNIEAARWCEELIALDRLKDSPTQIYNATYFQGSIAWSNGDFDLATQRGEELLRLTQEAGDKGLMISAYYLLAKTALSKGDLIAAEAALMKLLEISHPILLEMGTSNSLVFINYFLVLTAMLYQRKGDKNTAVKLFGAAEAICSWAIHLLSPRDGTERKTELAILRAGLGEEVFRAAWAEGQALSVDQALALAELIPAVSP